MLDGSAFLRQQLLAQQERQEETPEQRSSRVQQLAHLVKTGEYAVHSQRLALALLEWDPRRGGTRQSAEVADRRRAYMRDYMRKRRAHPTTVQSSRFNVQRGESGDATMVVA